MKKTLHMTKEKTKQSGMACSLYDERDFNRYVSGTMTGTEIERIEVHAEGCDACLRTLYRCQVAKEKEKEKEFVRRTLDLLDELDKTPVGNLLEILIKISGKLLEMVSTTGELLRTPTFVPTRGELVSASEERAEPLRIVQEFGTPPISLQATLGRCREEGCLDLKISVYNREEEEFMPGIGIELAGPEILEEMTTDEDGEVSFRIERNGEYKVNFSSGAGRIGEISLTVEMG